MRRRGLFGLGFWHNGIMQLSVNLALLSPADAKGLTCQMHASDLLAAQFQWIVNNPEKMSANDLSRQLSADSSKVSAEEKARVLIAGGKFE